jgi:hypothetical protein
VAFEVVEGQLVRLEHGAHGPVRHDDALGERTAKGVGRSAHADPLRLSISRRIIQGSGVVAGNSRRYPGVGELKRVGDLTSAGI